MALDLPGHVLTPCEDINDRAGVLGGRRRTESLGCATGTHCNATACQHSEGCSECPTGPIAGRLPCHDPVQSRLEQGDDIVDVHWCCKGRCDSVLKRRMETKYGRNVIDGWEDLSDMCIPLIYLRRTMAFLNGFQNGDRWSAEAFQKLKRMLITIYQHVARDASAGERQRIQRLLRIPDYVGGLGGE